MIAKAQPTPGFTSMAFTGQFLSHAPHSMQESFDTITAFLSFSSKTSWGQTLMHIPQPMHLSSSNSNSATFLKYLLFIVKITPFQFTYYPITLPAISSPKPIIEAKAIIGTVRIVSF